MRPKDRPTMDAFVRSARALGGPTMVIQLPVAMGDRQRYPGADRRVLAAVYGYDGKAVVVPSTLRCGILVCDWSKLMHYLRRRR